MKPLKSQWTFGELFPTEELRKVYGVGELTSVIRQTLEKQIGTIWVSGEITNLRRQSSGIIYFTIKDNIAQLSCVLFRADARSLQRDLLEDGQRIVLQGELTVYEQRGQYQLRVLAAEFQGMGALQAAFEKLKQRLQAEGLFAPERKRPLPRYPQRIGLITSPTGAALADVLHVIERRFSQLEIFFVPSRVQGAGAAEEIAAAIVLLNQWQERHSKAAPASAAARDGQLDLILLTRGGGSLEDLWAFNEEVVARAIYQSAVPVISAIGHEIDFTISDFVADFRAATPSAAAELITEGAFSARPFVAGCLERMQILGQAGVAEKRQELERLSRRLELRHPKRVLREQLQKIDDLQERMQRCGKVHVERCRWHWRRIGERLQRVRPTVLLAKRCERLQAQQQLLRNLLVVRLNESKSRLSQATHRLRLLSPLHTLERGYSITFDAETGKVVDNVAETRPGQKIRTRLKQGEVRSRIEPV